MKYNSSRNKLFLPEYGRNIQKLVEQAVLIKDKKERTEFIRKIIELMGKMYPYLRDLRDFKHKLWDHLVIMSDFKLGNDSPYEAPKSETYSKAPSKIAYSEKNIKWKHYGKIITQMIEHAIKMKEGKERNMLTELIANHMKKLYLIWNRGIVDDNTIINNMKTLSDNKLKIPPGFKLTNSKDLLPKKRNKRTKKGRIIKKNN